MHLKTTATIFTQTDIPPKNLQIDQLFFFPSYGMHAMIYFAVLGIFMSHGHRMQRC